MLSEAYQGSVQGNQVSVEILSDTIGGILG